MYMKRHASFVRNHFYKLTKQKDKSKTLINGTLSSNHIKVCSKYQKE